MLTNLLFPLKVGLSFPPPLPTPPPPTPSHFLFLNFTYFLNCVRGSASKEVHHDPDSFKKKLSVCMRVFVTPADQLSSENESLQELAVKGKFPFCLEAACYNCCECSFFLL